MPGGWERGREEQMTDTRCTRFGTCERAGAVRRAGHRSLRNGALGHLAAAGSAITGAGVDRLVLPDGRLLEPDTAALEDCAAVQCIKVDFIIPLGRARANGVTQRRRPWSSLGLIASQPGWTEAPIAAQRSHG